MTNERSFTCYLAGTESLLVQCAEILLANGHRILGVISSDPATRKWTTEKGLRALDLDASLPAVLEAEPFDFFFSITNLRVLPKDVVTLPRRMAINFHDGPLPRYAGLYATTWALLAGETEYAITWHRITTAGIDKGDILLQEPVAIGEGETALTLNAKCYEAGMASFGVLVERLAADTVDQRPQDLSRRTYFGMVKRPAGCGAIRWEESAARVAAHVAALDFGPYPNPLTLPKVWHGDRVYVVGDASVTNTASGKPPGVVVDSSPGRLVVATGQGDVMFGRISDATGLPFPDTSPATAATAVHPPYGAQLRRFAPEDLARWTGIHESVARFESFWAARLARAQPTALPIGAVDRSGSAESPDHGRLSSAIDPADVAIIQQRLGAGSRHQVVLATVAAFVARAASSTSLEVAYSDPEIQEKVTEADALFPAWVPLHVPIASDASFTTVARAVLDDLAAVSERQTFARDVVGRTPALRAIGARALPEHWPIRLAVGAIPPGSPAAGFGITVADDGQRIEWQVNNGAVSPWALEALAHQFQVFLHAVVADGNQPLDRYPLVDAVDRERMLVEWNSTACEYPREGCIHQLFEAEARRSPDARAVIFEGTSITYAELNARANRIARRLVGLGVRPGTIVGLAVPRSADMVASALAVLKAGGAYLPLDPEYPADRLRFMIEDSEAPVVIASTRADVQGGDLSVQVLALDEAAEREAIDQLPASDLCVAAASGDLAYLIYTSGSTGRPKGVMVEHRQVVAFFAGMDPLIAHDPPGVWLSVTSLSFDISVLEIFWTLTRGFTVVVQGEARNTTIGRADSLASRRPIDLSLFYFASDEGDRGAAKYRLLMEGAKFADANGFHAVWTPERHFHAFGGLYPNPSVMGAAIAAVTSRVGIRAGSVVLPLHHPIRVAEEWSLVDNLSGGRVGVSFASGWHPDDFVLRPEAFANAKHGMMVEIETVRRLWRGERVGFPGPLGKDVLVSTLPRPVQAELPVWITAAGNPETFRLAGEAGCFVLTHLLGQTLDELVEKVEVYRRAWRAGGHGESGGRVTLMLHTFVGESDDAARETVREPMKRYLGSALNLIKQYAWSFPAFRKRTEAAGASTDEIFKQLSAEDLDGLLEHAFERYYETSGLFGTPETCVAMIDRVKAAGIEEVACLIDFGVPHDEVVGSFERMAALRALVAEARPVDADDHSIPMTIERHRVTHLQCTPSLAGVLARDPDGRLALGRLRHLLVGGEAFPPRLATSLAGAVHGRITNMYGPTETTIWSACYGVMGDEDPVPIGRPIANTQIYVLDAHQQPVPVGVGGELYIGGDGVARGYHRRPDLTHERFVRDPFRSEPGARLYRTGDLARYRCDGQIEFLGRVDHQVKMRGFRIELGEIESCLAEHTDVQDVIVVAREDTNRDAVLVAYVVLKPGRSQVRADEIRALARTRLPEHMVPSRVVTLASYPLTPNGKVDRKRLPVPEVEMAEQSIAAVPENDLERTVAKIWEDVLQVPQVGIDQNFFDLGGHSLLTIRVLGRLREATGRTLPITDMFRFPTVRALAHHMAGGDTNALALAASDGRAAARREMMARRRRDR